MIYVDLNMVRAGVVQHPSEWVFSEYNEIQEPRRKFSLIGYERLSELAGFDSYDKLRSTYREWVNESLGDGSSIRDNMWTQSIAVGSEKFIERTKEALGIRAKGIRERGIVPTPRV